MKEITQIMKITVMDFMTNKKKVGFLYPAFYLFRKSRKRKIKQKLYKEFEIAQENKDFVRSGILAKRILNLDK